MDGIKFPKVLKFNGHVARSLKSVYHLLSGLIIAMMSSYLTLVDANQFGPLGYLHNELERIQFMVNIRTFTIHVFSTKFKPETWFLVAMQT